MYVLYSNYNSVLKHNTLLYVKELEHLRQPLIPYAQSPKQQHSEAGVPLPL